MIPLTGKKIFILYPDSFLRNEIFHGNLRNQYQIYFIFDYEKVKPIAEYYPGCIFCINLVANDLGWLITELEDELEGISAENYPKLAVLTDKNIELPGKGFKLVDCGRSPDSIQLELQSLFAGWGGKGRRNFVRYGGVGETVAGLRTVFEGREINGIVHDISASGLSCSFSEDPQIPISNETMEIALDLSGTVIELTALKILERDIDNQTIHVLQFDKSMTSGRLDELYRFIHESLDSKMDQFIKKLSN